MKKLGSSLANMVIVLTFTTLLAGFLLSFVNSVTEEPRKKAEEAKRTSAIDAVVSGFDNDPAADAWTTEVDGMKQTVYPARTGGNLIGGAVETTTSKGFSGDIVLIVGFDTDGNVLGYEVTSHAETPGLGAKMQDWFRTGGGKIIGTNPTSKPLGVAAKKEGDIDGITAATISSRAFLGAVNNAAQAWQQYQGQSASDK